MKTYFYEKTGMYIDWEQIKSLPKIDTFIDIGVGSIGTEDLYNNFPEAKLILLDPLDEADNYAKNKLQHREYSFYKYAVGSKAESKYINIERDVNRSTLLEVTNINFEGEPLEKKLIRIDSLDNLLKNESNLGSVGIKIDTEGFELDVIKGSKETLKKCKFLISETRHNHESFQNQYKLHQFIKAMQDENFILSKIFTAKPLIADLCFEPIKELDF